MRPWRCKLFFFYGRKKEAIDEQAVRKALNRPIGRLERIRPQIYLMVLITLPALTRLVEIKEKSRKAIDLKSSFDPFET